jgi:PAS domain S-box-containing protein
VDPLDIISKSDAAAFATDEEDRIVVWNKAAERLLGYSAERVLGKPCHQVLCGRDVFGNRYCDEHCPMVGMYLRHEPVRHFEMEVQGESGERIPASFSIVGVPGSRRGQFTLIHFLQPVDRRGEVDEILRRLLAGSAAPTPPSLTPEPHPPAPPPSLTTREIEVLRLLADGVSTREIADSLFISVTTTRNHIQNILRKLDVHSKLGAVTLAFRTHIL